ncbi:MAG: hypothetical protein ABF250_10340 [Polaribacter sp.]|uniref:hypothetical protein n=1 Tax=Polaribacter sp. TaxID=1920175 RepID=UPI00321A0CEF
MTLLSKLKPEYKEVFEKQNIEFPTLIERIINCFETTEFVSDIPFGIWMDIKFFTNTYSPFELFNDNI